jgi:hypothetical protein
MAEKEKFVNPYDGKGLMELSKQLEAFNKALETELIAGIRAAYKKEARNVLFAKINYFREEIVKCYKKMEEEYDYIPRKKGDKK